jgi:hypothetical protein
MSVLQKFLSFVLACASSAIVARAQSQTTPGPEVKKLAVMVGKFTIEDELKAGFMGPNSPAMKFSGTDDCRWTAGGFAVICEAVLYRPGRKYSDTSFVYYDPTSKTYRYHAVDSSGGVEDKTGTVSGDVWTWLGESVFGGKMYHTRYIMKVVSAARLRSKRCFGWRCLYQHLALLAAARMVGVGEFEQFDGRAVFDYERDADAVGWAVGRNQDFAASKLGGEISHFKRDVRNLPDEIRDRRVRFETHPLHAKFAFLVADDKEFQVFQVGLARLRFSSGNSDVMVPAHCFSLSVELAQILRCRYRV